MIVQSIYKDKEKVASAYKNDVITIISDLRPSENSIVLKTSDIEQLKNIQNLIKQKKRQIRIDMELNAYIGQKIKLKIVDENFNVVNLENDYIVENSIKMPTTKENIINQLNKLGDTNYILNECNINIDKNSFVPVKIINELRREAINTLNQIRTNSRKIKKNKYYIDIPDLVVYNNYDCNIIQVPRVQERLKDLSGNLLVGELGSVYKYCDGVNNVTTDFSLNVTNSYSVALLHSLGVNKVTLSVELQDYQIKKIVDNYFKRYKKKPNLELIVKGTLEAMILKYDLFDGTYDKKFSYYLKDKYGNKFPVVRKDNLTYIYFYTKLDKKRNIYHDYGISSLREIL